MQFVQDSFGIGSLVAAWLRPSILADLEPMLGRFLRGQQLYVKQADGSWHPKGSQLGLTRNFQFSDLVGPSLRNV
jgi:hypothetical protein